MKYKLGEKHPDLDLYRVVALKDFGNVEKGDVGGWVESEKNLSQEGDCWVYGSAKVYGNACVSGNAWVYDNAQVTGSAQVSGNAEVYGSARVFESAVVSGNAEVYGSAEICGNTKVSGSTEVSVILRDTIDSADDSGEKDESPKLFQKEYEDLKNELVNLKADVSGLLNLFKKNTLKCSWEEKVSESGIQIAAGPTTVKKTGYVKGVCAVPTPQGIGFVLLLHDSDLNRLALLSPEMVAIIAEE